MVDLSSRADPLKRAPRFAVKTARRLAIRRYMRRRFAARPNHPALSRDAALAMVRAADSVLILCWGNVCRSPLAERYLDGHPRNQPFQLTVESGGLGETEGRASPQSAVEAAADYGVDLSNHRSKRTGSAAVGEADVVFVMDYNNYYSVTSRYPGSHHKTFFLGALDDAPDVQIRDPYGSSRERFDETFARITAAIDTLVDELEDDR